jgi:hypothetical protein
LAQKRRLNVPAGRDLLDGHKKNGFVIFQKSNYGGILLLPFRVSHSIEALWDAFG